MLEGFIGANLKLILRRSHSIFQLAIVVTALHLKHRRNVSVRIRNPVAHNNHSAIRQPRMNVNDYVLTAVGLVDIPLNHVVTSDVVLLAVIHEQGRSTVVLDDCRGNILCKLFRNKIASRAILVLIEQAAVDFIQLCDTTCGGSKLAVSHVVEQATAIENLRNDAIKGKRVARTISGRCSRTASYKGSQHNGRVGGDNLQGFGTRSTNEPCVCKSTFQRSHACGDVLTRSNSHGSTRRSGSHTIISTADCSTRRIGSGHCKASHAGNLLIGNNTIGGYQSECGYLHAVSASGNGRRSVGNCTSSRSGNRTKRGGIAAQNDFFLFRHNLEKQVGGGSSLYILEVTPCGLCLKGYAVLQADNLESG